MLFRGEAQLGFGEIKRERHEGARYWEFQVLDILLYWSEMFFSCRGELVSHLIQAMRLMKMMRLILSVSAFSGYSYVSGSGPPVYPLDTVANSPVYITRSYGSPGAC